MAKIGPQGRTATFAKFSHFVVTRITERTPPALLPKVPRLLGECSQSAKKETAHAARMSYAAAHICR
jgi:hypothetical protein